MIVQMCVCLCVCVCLRMVAYDCVWLRVCFACVGVWLCMSCGFVYACICLCGFVIVYVRFELFVYDCMFV